MSLRLKLLLLGLATLVLPWAGCRYAREMESALRQGEVDSLNSLSQTIATSLQGRTDLLYREGARRKLPCRRTAPRKPRQRPPRPTPTSTGRRPTIWSR